VVPRRLSIRFMSYCLVYHFGFKRKTMLNIFASQKVGCSIERKFIQSRSVTKNHRNIFQVGSTPPPTSRPGFFQQLLCVVTHRSSIFIRHATSGKTERIDPDDGSATRTLNQENIDRLTVASKPSAKESHNDEGLRK
jgi:hypothetical protein